MRAPGGPPPLTTAVRTAVAAIVVAMVLLALVVAVATPAWEANDEPDHVRNVEMLALGQWYTIEPNSGYQPHQPPLYYLLLAGLERATGITPRLPDPRPGPGIVGHGLFDHNDGEEQHRVMLFRLVSVVLAAGTLLCTAGIARWAGARRWTVAAAVAIVAGVPRFVFLSGVVNNDNLATFLGALATYLTVRVIRRPDDRRLLPLLVGLGVVAGALVETKLSTIPFAGVLLAGALWGAVRNAPRPFALRRALALVLPAVAVALPILVANQVRYGDPLAAHRSVEYFKGWIPGLVAVPRSFHWFAVTITSGFLTSFWYVSGWNQFRWRAAMYVPFWALAVVGLAGLAVGNRLAARRRRAEGEPEGSGARGSRRAAYPSVVPLLAVAFVAAASSVWVLAWNTTQWQARIAYPGLPAFGVLVALGYQRLRLPALAAFVLPALGLVGTLHALRADVFARYF